MAKASDNLFPKLKLGPAGTTPAAPSDSSWTMYSMSDGVYARSSNTSVGPFGTGGGGSVATDAIWDASGDLAVGSGANTAARLAIGATNGMVLTRVSGAVAWALPPGYEFDYAAFTANVTISATAEGSADTVKAGNAVTYDGSTTVLIEFFAPACDFDGTAAGGAIIIVLLEDSTVVGRIATLITADTTNTRHPVYGAVRRTPSNASHTYTVKAYVSGADTANVGAGTGGSGNNVAGFLRVTKV